MILVIPHDRECEESFRAFELTWFPLHWKDKDYSMKNQKWPKYYIPKPNAGGIQVCNFKRPLLYTNLTAMQTSCPKNC